MQNRPAQQVGARTRPRGIAAVYALPSGLAALLAVGAFAAATRGAISAGWVLLLSAIIVAVTALIAEPGAALFVAGGGWLATAGFSAPPYAQLRITGSAGLRNALILAACTAAGLLIGAGVRAIRSSFTLWIVRDDLGVPEEAALPARESPSTARVNAVWRRLVDRTSGLDRRRQIAGAGLVLLMPVLTAALLPAAHAHALRLPDDLLIFLVSVVGIAVVGGFWPAVLAAVTASLLLNWFFTPPVHTFTIADPQNILALLLFITVAVSVSSVVHLAARRADQAARSKQDAAALLTLAQTVLGGEDTPSAVLDHLTGTWGGRAELAELVKGQWVTVAVAGSAPGGDPDGAPGGAPGTAEPVSVRAGDNLTLVVSGQHEAISPRLRGGFAAQAAAALDRDRLRTQAAQAEALAEGNRMRTALLAAVSHDLRTPLASIKASVGTLREPGVELPDDDEAALLATIEQSADRLNALIGNLLDMSRLAAGSLEPFLRPASIDEVAPLAFEPGTNVRLVVPDDLPLVRTDPGLLERVLANLFANAIAHSPAGLPPVMVARSTGDLVVIDVIDQGKGVPDGSKQRMFEPFERLTDRGTGNGVGLGLAVAKGFLTAMGGTIEAVDTPGGGLTMRVTLPVAVSVVGAGSFGAESLGAEP